MQSVHPEDLPPELRAKAEAIPSGTGMAEKDLGSLLNYIGFLWANRAIDEATRDGLLMHLSAIVTRLGYPASLIQQIADDCREISLLVTAYMAAKDSPQKSGDLH